MSAAEYNGVERLPRPVFFAAAERLGLSRDEAAEAPSEETQEAERLPQDSRSPLLLELDRFREQMTETATIRDALLRMRKVIRAALDATA